MIGTEEAVQEAQKELEELIKSLVRLQMTFKHRMMRSDKVRFSYRCLIY